MNVEFRTSRYVASHGRLPRGRGCWFFEDAASQIVFQSKGNTSLTEAKKQYLLSRRANETLVTVWVSP